MKSLIAAALPIVPALVFSSNVSSAQFTEDFSGSLPSPSWNIGTAPGYSIEFANGRGAFSKVGSTATNTGAGLYTSFLLDGNFEVSVDLDARSASSLYEGLNIGWRDSTTFAQIYLIGNRLFQGSGSSVASYTFNNSTTTVFDLTFKITRVETTMSISFDRGQGAFETYYTTNSSIYSGPVRASLNIEASSDALSTAYFDNFFVRADTITQVPEPQSAALLFTGVLFVAQQTRRRMRSPL